MKRFDDVDVKIVPVGLNYFRGHRFRSQVVIEFGEPIEIDQDLKDRYCKGDKAARYKARGDLLAKVKTRLESVTLSAPSFNDLTNIHTIRRLYMPTGLRLTAHDHMALTRRIAHGYMKFKDNPGLKSAIEHVEDYKKNLRELWVKDHHIAAEGKSSTFFFFASVLWRCGVLITIAMLSFPGFIINAPIALVAKFYAEKEAKKRASSSLVKIEGKDVIASYKLIMGLVLTPVIYLIYAGLVSYYLGIMTGLIFYLLLPFFSYAR